ncbi:MAG: tetratricopeptide repeat protein [Candidatus Eisenbacteria bacterium]|nr:tetratricopeptide repeat protein [Candidatus Eisenbacteria bacterium]
MSCHPGLTLLAALTIQVVTRLVYLIYLHRNPFFADPILDSRLYDSWALQIAAGDWLGHDVFFMGPLYPYLLALIYLVVGHNPFAAVAVQQAVGAISCLLVFLIARRVSGALVALTAAVILAFYGPLLFFEGLLLPESLGIFLSMLWLYLLVRAEAGIGLGTCLWTGVLVGLAALVRGSALIFLVGILSWFAIRLGIRKTRTWLLFMGVLAGTAVAIAPATLHNYVVGHDLVMITSNGGLNLYIGNNEKANGLYNPIKELRMVGADPESDWTGKHHAEQLLGRTLIPSQVSTYWMNQSVHFIVGKPIKFITLLLRKLLLFWNAYEFPQIDDYYIWRDASRFPLPLMSFVFVGPLAITGIVLTLRKREKFLLLHIFVATYTVSICLFFVTARYRVHIVPVLAIFSSYALWWLIDRIDTRQYRQAGLALCVVIASVALTGRPMLSALGISPSVKSWYWHFSRGTKFLNDPSRLDDAIRELTQAVQLNPRNPEAFNNLGMAYEKKGVPARATAIFQDALRIDSTYVEARYNLAFLKQKEGDYTSAIQLYRKVLELQPYLPRAHFNLGICCFRSGDPAAAAYELRKTLELEPGSAEAHNQLGIVRGEQGALDDAVEEFEAALRLNPGYPAARANLELARKLESARRRSSAPVH